MMSWRKDDADYSYDRRRHRDTDSNYKHNESTYHVDVYGRDARNQYYPYRRHEREDLRTPYESSRRTANLPDRVPRDIGYQRDNKVPVRERNYPPKAYTKDIKPDAKYLRQTERGGPSYDYDRDRARQNYHDSDRKSEASYSSQSEHERRGVYSTKQKGNSIYSADDKPGNKHTRNSPANRPGFDDSAGINRDFGGSKQRSYQDRHSPSKPHKVSYDYQHKPAQAIDKNVQTKFNNEEITHERLVQNSGNKSADTDLRQTADFNDMFSNALKEQTTPLNEPVTGDTGQIYISDENLGVPTDIIEIDDDIADTDYRQTALNAFLSPVNKEQKLKASQKLQDTILDISKTIIQLESKLKQNKSGDKAGTNTEKIAKTDISSSTSTPSIDRNIKTNSIRNIQVIDDRTSVTEEQLQTINLHTNNAGTGTLVNVPGFVSPDHDIKIPGKMSPEQDARIPGIMSAEQYATLPSNMSLNRDTIPDLLSANHFEEQEVINSDQELNVKKSQNVLNKTRNHQYNPINTANTEPKRGGQKTNLLDNDGKPWLDNSPYMFSEYKHGKKLNRERRKSNEQMKHDNKYRNTENRYERWEETQQHNYRQKDAGNKNTFDRQNHFDNHQKHQHPEGKLSLGKQDHENSWRQRNQGNGFRQDKNTWRPIGQNVQERNTTKATEWSKDKHLTTKEEGVRDGEKQIKSSSTCTRVNQDGTDAAKETGKKSLKDFKIPKIRKINKEPHNKDRSEEDELKHMATNEMTVAVKNPITFTSKEIEQDKSKTINSSSGANLNIFEKLNVHMVASKVKEVEKQPDHILKSKKEKQRNEKSHSYDSKCSGIFDRMHHLLKKDMAKKNRESKEKDLDRPMSYPNDCRKETLKETTPSEGFASDDAPSIKNSKNLVTSVKDLKYVNGQLYWKNSKLLSPNIEVTKMTKRDIESMKINIMEAKTVQLHTKLNSKKMEKVYSDKQLQYRIRTMNDSELSDNSSPVKFEKKQVKPLSESETELSPVVPKNKIPHILSESDNENSPVICGKKTVPILSEIESQLSPVISEVETSVVETSVALSDDELEEGVYMEIGSDDGLYMEIGSDDETQPLEIDLTEIKQEPEVSEIKKEHSDTENSSSGLDKSNIKSEFDNKQREGSESENTTKNNSENSETSTLEENTNNSLEPGVSRLETKASSGESFLMDSQSSARDPSQLGSNRQQCTVSVIVDNLEEEEESQSILGVLTGGSNVKPFIMDSCHNLVNEFDNSNGKEYSQKCDKKIVSDIEKYSDDKVDKMAEIALSRDDDLPVIKRPKVRKRVFSQRSSFDYEDTVSKTNDSTVSKTNDTKVCKTSDNTASKVNDTTCGKTSDTTVGKTNDTTDVKISDTTVSKTNDTTVSKTNHTTVSKVNDTTVGKTKDTTVGKTNDTTVSKTNHTTVCKTSDTTVSKINDATVSKTSDTTVGKTNNTTVSKTNHTTVSKVNDTTVSKIDDTTVSKTNNNTGDTSDQMGQIAPVKKKLFKPSKNIPSAAKEEEAGNEGDVEDNLNAYDKPTQKYDNGEALLSYNTASDDNSATQQYSFPPSQNQTQKYGNSIKVEKCSNRNKAKAVEGDGNSMTVKEEPNWLKNGYTQEPDTIFISDDEDFDMVMSVSQPIISLDSSESENEDVKLKTPAKIKTEVNEFANSDINDPDYWDVSSLVDDSDKGSDYEPEHFFEMISRLSEVKHVDSDETENEEYSDNDPYMSSDNEDPSFNPHYSKTEQAAEGFNGRNVSAQVDATSMEETSPVLNECVKSPREENVRSADIHVAETQQYLAVNDKDKSVPCSQTQVGENMDMYMQDTQVDSDSGENDSNQISALEYHSEFFSDHSNSSTESGSKDVTFTGIKIASNNDEVEQTLSEKTIYIEDVDDEFSIESSSDESDIVTLSSIESISKLETQYFQISDNEDVATTVDEMQSFDEKERYTEATQIDDHCMTGDNNKSSKSLSKDDSDYYGSETQVFDNNEETLSDYLSATQVDKGNKAKGKAVKQTIDYEGDTQVFDNNKETLSDYSSATQVDKGNKAKGKAVKQTIDYEGETQVFDNNEETLSDYLSATQVDKGNKTKGKVVKQIIDYEGETQVFENNEENLSDYSSATQVDKGPVHPSKGNKAKGKAVKQTIDYEGETQVFDNRDENLSDYSSATQVDKDPVHLSKGKRAEGKTVKQSSDYEGETQRGNFNEENLSNNYQVSSQIDNKSSKENDKERSEIRNTQDLLDTQTFDLGDFLTDGYCEQTQIDRDTLEDTSKEGIDETASLATKQANYEDETQSFDSHVDLQNNYVTDTQVDSPVEDDERYNAETQIVTDSDSENIISDLDELIKDPQYSMYIQKSTGLSSSKFNAQLGIKFDNSFHTELKFPDDDVHVVAKSKTFEGQDDIYSAQTQYIDEGSSATSKDRDNDAYMEQTQLDPQYMGEEEDELRDQFLAQTQIDNVNKDSMVDDQTLKRNDNMFDILTQIDDVLAEHQDYEEKATVSDKRSKEELSLPEQVSKVEKKHAIKSSDHFKGKRPYSEVNQRDFKCDERLKNSSAQPKNVEESSAKKAKIDTKQTQLAKETTKSHSSGRPSASVESEQNIPNLCVQGRQTIMIDPINSRSRDPTSGPNCPQPRSKSFLAVNLDIIADATKDDMWLSKKRSKDKGKSKPEKRKRNKSNDSALDTARINEARWRLQERNMKCMINPDCAADPNKRLKHSTLSKTAENAEDVDLPSFSQVIKKGYPIMDTSHLNQRRKSSQPETTLHTEVTTSTATMVTNTVTMSTTTATSATMFSNVHWSIPTCSVVTSTASHTKTLSKRDTSKSDKSTSRIKGSEHSKSESHKSSKVISKVKSSESNRDEHQLKSSHHKHEHKSSRSDKDGDKKYSKKAEPLDKSNKDGDKKSSKTSKPLDKSNKDGDKKSSKKSEPLDKSNKDGDKKSSKTSKPSDKSNKDGDKKSSKKSEPLDKSNKDSISLHRKENKVSEKSADRKGRDVSERSHEKRDRHSSGKEKSLSEKSRKDKHEFDKSMNKKDKLVTDKSCENKNKHESEKSDTKRNKLLSDTSHVNKDKDVVNKTNNVKDKHLQKKSLERGEKDSRSQSSRDKSKVIEKNKSDKSSSVRDSLVQKTDERESITREKSGIKQKSEIVIQKPDAKQKNVASDTSKHSDPKTSDNSESTDKTFGLVCEKHHDEQNNRKERSHIRKDPGSKNLPAQASDRRSEVSLGKQPLRDLHNINNIKTLNTAPVGINLMAKISAGNGIQSSGSVLSGSNTKYREHQSVSSIKTAGLIGLKKKRKVTWCDDMVQVKEISPDQQRPSTSAENLMKKIPLGPSFLPIQTENLPPDLMKMTNPVKWDKVITIILKWNSVWFEERDKMELAGRKKCDSPPVAEQLGVVDTKALFPLVKRYASLDEYINKFMLPLLLHETWQSLYSDWREKKNRGKLYKLKLFRNQYANFSEKLQEYTFIGLMSREERNLRNLNEQDLVTLKIFCQGKTAEGDIYRDILGLVVSVTYKESPVFVNRICSQNAQLAKIRRHDSIQVILTVRVHKTKRSFTPCQVNLTELQPVSSILSIKRQINALDFFQRSPLCRDLMYPTPNAVYCERAKASLSHDRPFLKVAYCRIVVYRKGLTEIMTCDMLDKRLSYLKKLNESQSVAVNTAVRIATHVAAAAPRVCLLQGPPGTGKSFTIVNIIHRIVKEKKGKCHICLTAPSHAAVDELLRKLHRMNFEPENKETKIKVVRLGKKHSIHPDVQCYSLDNCVEKRFKETLLEKLQDVPQSLRAEMITVKNKILEVQNNIRASKDKFQIQKWSSDLVRLKKERGNLESKFQIDKTNIPAGMEKKLKSEVLNGAHVIAGTLSSMGGYLLKMFLNKSNAFDCVIVDEATQATEIDTLIPLQYGATKLILVGDPEQLNPTVLSQVAQENKFNMSLFERLYNHFNDSGNITNPVIFLDTQYRMDVEIASFPNNYIYDKKLKTAGEHKNCNLVPYLLYDIREGEEQFSQGSRSMSNQMEAEFTAELCQFILQKTKFSEKSIGIIAPYSKQKDEVLKKLALRRLNNIEVSTVDGFQGREKHIVIMTCVRAVSGSLGFVGNRNRMNVALTRAKYAMYLVGHFGALESSDEWRALIDDAKQRNKMVTVSTDTYAQDICSCLKR